MRCSVPWQPRCHTAHATELAPCVAAGQRERAAPARRRRTRVRCARKFSSDCTFNARRRDNHPRKIRSLYRGESSRSGRVHRSCTHMDTIGFLSHAVFCTYYFLKKSIIGYVVEEYPRYSNEKYRNEGSSVDVRYRSARRFHQAKHGEHFTI